MGSLKSRGYLSGRVGHGDRAAVPLGKGAGRANVYRILIGIVAVFFLVETIANGLVFLKMRDSDLQGGPPNFFLRASETTIGQPGDGVRFVPRLLLSRGKVTMAELRKELRTPVRSPRLAVVCPNLALSPLSLYELSIISGLREIGYYIEVYTLKDGELRSTWESMGVAVKLLETDSEKFTTVDWLNYEGVVAVSLNTKSILDSLAQEPFAKVPVIWILTDDALGRRLGKYKAENSTELIDGWRQSFRRADVVAFPDYVLPMIYTTLDTGNFFVIPGSPAEVWTAEEYKVTHSRDSLRAQYEVHPDDSVVAVVGGPFLYKWRWREHALVIRALTRAVSMLSNASHKSSRRIQLFIIGHGNHSSSYGAALQVMADHLKLKNGTVRYVGAGEDVTGIVWMSDAVVYGSLRDEQGFPPILCLAMSLERPVIAPNRRVFREQISDGENGVLFPVGDEMKLSQALVHVLEGTALVGAMALTGQWKARNMHALNVSLSYGELLESILEFPPEAALPRRLDEAEKSLKGEWRWELLFPANASFQTSFQSRIGERVREDDDVGSGIIDTLEEHWKITSNESQSFAEEIGSHASSVDLEIPSHTDLDEAKAIQEDIVSEEIELEELEWRNEVVQTPLEYITKMIRKTEVRKDELKERSDAEIQRNAQPLTIYEPYHGKGAWPFLHEGNTLYRGLSLTTLDRRPGDDDVDGEVRLPGLLNETYYRSLLCEYGAFFAIANRIDLIHRNPWIGFQPWRTLSKDVALTPAAEAALVKAAGTGEDGDAVYFWARSDGHAGTWLRDSSVDHPEDFWTSCDSYNSGQCREAFSRCWRHMYGLPTSWTDLPLMPADGGTWSAMHSWAMATPSFVEFILFARMFVDALDAQYYEEHHDLGKCRFVKFQREGQHCYCGVLDGLVNVWAYHSARRMIYMDPKTGAMEEQHALDSRHGKMWVKYLSRDTLKGMDEDLAQAADDSDLPRERWLWPLTGEVFWEGIFERERQERWRLKMERNQKQKEKQALIRSRLKQQAIGKVVKHSRVGEER